MWKLWLDLSYFLVTDVCDVCGELVKIHEWIYMNDSGLIVRCSKSHE